MMNRTILAALLAGLAAPVLAGVSGGPTFQQASELAEGRSANAAYDGNLTQTAVSAQAGALTAGAPSVQTPAAAPQSARSSLTAAVPEPPTVEKKGSFIKSIFTKRALMVGAGGAVVGGGLGFLVGGPLGAVLGALAGFLIGVAMSKFLHKKH
jgi:hypothetical protein